MPTSDFPFLSLPRELRDQIYKHLLTATYKHFLPNTKGFQKSLSFGSRALKEPQSSRSHPYPYPRLAILLVSKSIHEEAKYILHKHATFVFNNLRSINSLPLAFLKDMKLIQNVVIELTAGYPYWDHQSELHAAIDLVNHFSLRLDSSPPRASCVVKCLFDADAFVHLMSSRNGDFQLALAGLTGFRTVELEVIREGRNDGEMSVLIPIFDRLGISLERRLGGEEVRNVDKWFVRSITRRVGEGGGWID